MAKHGNRAASSKCGAADVLEALGVTINLPPERSADLLKDIGICFLFAQNYHIAMKYVAPIRRELGIRTVFNTVSYTHLRKLWTCISRRSATIWTSFLWLLSASPFFVFSGFT